MLHIAIPAVVLGKPRPQALEQLPDVRQLRRVPLPGDPLGEAFPGDPAHDDEVVDLHASPTHTTEDLEGQREHGVAEGRRVLLEQLLEILRLCQDVGRDPSTSDELQDEVLQAGAGDEPDPLVQPAPEALHRRDIRSLRPLQLLEELRPQRRPGRREGVFRTEVQLQHLQAPAADEVRDERGCLGEVLTPSGDTTAHNGGPHQRSP
mmetsp:Transcript_69777/g.202479  ORF Transcript_69777/g.202479 Transcript_69777/m.202479 type:complete len:206 (-) Transcript_69777:321-938(-)